MRRISSAIKSLGAEAGCSLLHGSVQNSPRASAAGGTIPPGLRFALLQLALGEEIFVHVRTNIAEAASLGLHQRLELGHQLPGIENLWRRALDGLAEEVHVALDSRLGRSAPAAGDIDEGGPA